MQVLDIFNTVIGMSLTVIVFVISFLVLIAGIIRHNLYKRMSRIIGRVIGRKGSRMTLEWTFQGKTYIASKGHPLLPFIYSNKVPLRVHSQPPQASFDYWFNNGISLSLIGTLGMLLSGGGFIALLLL